MSFPFYVQKHFTAFTICSLVYYYTPAPKERGVYCFTLVCHSVRHSVRHTFYSHTFLSNHLSQDHKIWYAASVWGPILWDQIWSVMHVYFLFPDLVNFLTLRTIYGIFSHTFLSNY